MAQRQSISLGNLLRQHRRVGFDTMILIYYLQNHPRYAPTVSELFHRMETREVTGVTSVVTLVELLVRPLALGEHSKAANYRVLLRSYPNLEVRPITFAEADRAAAVRANYGIATPDALQIATALESSCTAFLTNDATLARISELPIVVLDSYLSRKRST